MNAQAPVAIHPPASRLSAAIGRVNDEEERLNTASGEVVATSNTMAAQQQAAAKELEKQERNLFTVESLLMTAILERRRQLNGGSTPAPADMGRLKKCMKVLFEASAAENVHRNGGEG